MEFLIGKYAECSPLIPARQGVPLLGNIHQPDVGNCAQSRSASLGCRAREEPNHKMLEFVLKIKDK